VDDRIKLAKAMEIGITRSPDGRIISRESSTDFDPFTDANDDRAVLEYFRKRALDHPAEWQVFKAYFTIYLEDWSMWNYVTGLFARAALKVIDND